MAQTQAETLGARCKALLGAANLTAPALSREFAAQWKARSGEELSPGRVEARLGALLRDKPVGAWFFFAEEPARAALLCELCKINSLVQRGLQESAASFLRSAEARPRMVIDLSRVPPEKELRGLALREIEKKLLPVGTLTALVAPEAIYTLLPKTLFSREDVLLVRAPNEDEARTRAEALAGERALFASFGRFHDFGRWLALGVDKKGLLIEPADGVEVFFGNGSLPVPPPIRDELSSIGVLPAPMSPLLESFLNNSAPHIRQITWRLQTEPGVRNLKLAPESRLTIARALGVKALASPREVLEARIRKLTEPAKLPFVPQDRSPEERAEAIQNAKRRPVQCVSFWVHEELTLLNYPDTFTKKVKGWPGVVVVEQAYLPPAITRLQEGLRARSPEEAEADPFLRGAVARLAGPDEELLFLHAAASLLLTGTCPPPVEPPLYTGDWRAALGAILREEAPPASLCLQDQRAPQLLSPLGHRVTPCLARRPALAAVEALLDFVPPPAVRRLTATRDDAGEVVALSVRRTKLSAAERTADDTAPRASLREYELAFPLRELERLQARQEDLLSQPRDPARDKELREVEAGLVEQLARAALPMLLPLDRALVEDAEKWRDLAEASPACGGSLKPPTWMMPLLQARQVLPPAVWRFGWRATTLDLSESFQMADAMLPDLYLLLRRALERGEAVRTQAGAWRLPLGGGLFAEVFLRESRGARAATFLLPIEEERILDPHSRREFYSPRPGALGHPLGGPSRADESSERLWRDPVWHREERRVRNDSLRIQIPRELTLRGGGFGATLHLGFSALLAAAW